MPRKLPEIMIRRDKREKENHGWWFEPENKKPGKVQIMGTIEDSLDAGDYSIVGLENVVRIERKNGFCELFGNMCPRANKERFEREMEKLSHIKHAYILIESNLTNDILSLSVPQMRQGPPSSRILTWLVEIQLKYGVNFMFTNECGKRMAKNIFRQAARKYLH